MNRPMREPTIRLQFGTLKAAYEAFETLQELDYRPELAEFEGRPAIDIQIENHDVQSALEIADAFGGGLAERDDETPARIDFEPNDEVNIPAHAVTEDFSERYLSGANDDFLGDEYDVVREMQEGYRDSVH
jgi:hypothetical protein